jgi:integrase
MEQLDIYKAEKKVLKFPSSGAVRSRKPPKVEPGHRKADSDAAIRSLKPEKKPYKASDSGGLYMLVNTTGGKLWRMKYYFPKGGKEKLLSFGAYPEVGLADARKKRDDAKISLADGIDPGSIKAEVRVLEKANAKLIDSGGDSFRAWAQRYVERKTNPKGSKPWAIDYAASKVSLLTKYANPLLGDLHVKDIGVRQVIEVLEACEKKSGAPTAERFGYDLRAVFRLAKQKGAVDKDHSNPAGDLKGVIDVPPGKNYPSITEPRRAGQVLDIIFQEPTQQLRVNAAPQTFWGLRFLSYVFVRPGNLHSMEWSEIDWDKKVWLIPGPKMKKKIAFAVPLSTQALAILETMKGFTAEQKYIFGGITKKDSQMSNATLNKYLAANRGISKIELVPHGFRAMAHTLCEEELGFSEKICDLSLAHRKKNDVFNGAYDRAKWWPDRVRLMQAWADYADELRAVAVATRQ